MAIQYRKFQPNEYVMAVKKGKVIRKGLGLSVLYNTMQTSLLVIPATEADVSFAFDDILTADFQKVSIQGDVSYVIEGYEKAAALVDFTFRTARAEAAEAKKEASLALQRRITNRAKGYIARFINEMDVRKAVVSCNNLAAYLADALREDEMIQSLGLRIITVAVLGIVPQPDMRKALEAAAREQILKEQDDALYKRRNAAIEQERAIKENELNTEIRVAEKQKEQEEKKMETRRMLQERQAEIDTANMEAQIALEEKNRELVDLQTENERKKAEAKLYEVREVMESLSHMDPEIVKAFAFSGMDSGRLIAQAFQAMGEHAEKIGTLNVTPDLLSSLGVGH